MPDFITPADRSRNMAAIHSSNTAPELMVRKALFKLGFRYRVTPKNMKGRPDIVLPKYKAVIFIHGCFWHGHWCPKYRVPKSNSWYWAEKIHRNKTRDQDNIERLFAAEWRVAVVWECAIKGPKRGNRLADTIETLVSWLRSLEPEIELPQPVKSDS